MAHSRAQFAALRARATRMPKPGRWMLHLRRVLGVALGLTALWLLGVLATQQGPLAAGVVAAMLVVLALGFAFAARLPAALRQAIVQALADDGPTVIAEGVETEDQGHMLLQMGCTQAQGYFIARPMPAQTFLAWLHTWQAPQAWAR